MCLSWVNDKKGVYFWDHEHEDDEEKLPSWGNMYYLAESFTVFIDSLKKYEPGEIKLKSEQIQSVWVDPEFLEKMKKKQSPPK